MTRKKLIPIVISEVNFNKLKNLGKAGDSFNDVISEILEKMEAPHN